MDLSTEEFQSKFTGLKGADKKEESENVHEMTWKAAPASVDWRTSGKVSAIKDQGQCGSCWAFSTTGSLESASAIFGKGLLSLSEQQLVDCSTSFGNQGCNGGLMDNAFEYVIANGITTEAAYPYKAVDQTCATDGGDFKISKYTNVKKPSILKKTCPDLVNAVALQPVSVGVDAEQWQFYSGGIFSDCQKTLDHGVLAVGYDTDTNWIVKNSWGVSWGEQGFIRLKKGNTCCICNTASYPTI